MQAVLYHFPPWITAVFGGGCFIALVKLDQKKANALTLAELLFSMPASNGKFERVCFFNVQRHQS